jgi:hypothetical protein
MASHDKNYNTSAMAHKLPNQIAWLSKFLTLSPGDVVATGTFHEGLMPVNVGDTIEIEFENMGRAKFNIKGNSPRKDVPWLPGKNQPTPPPGGWHACGVNNHEKSGRMRNEVRLCSNPNSILPPSSFILSSKHPPLPRQ